ncbi:MAG: alkaline phosphatase family protein [Myxococcota bacterium]
MRTSLMAVIALFAIAAACTESSTPKPESPRVVVIGIDGADWDILDPLVATGRMPTLARLMARGSYGELETIEPILSPIIWTTIATGRRPDEHGITWFMERDAKGNTKPISSRLRRVPALWNIASNAGLSVGVAGWWATWPAETIDGYIVSDHAAAHGFGLTAKNVDTELGRTHPESLWQEIAPLRVRPSDILNREVLEYMDITPAELATRNGDEMDFGNPLHHFLYALSAHRTYENIGIELLKRKDTRLSMHYFEATDSLSHLFMKYADPPLAGIPEGQRARFKKIVPKIYERQDRVLASLLEAAGPNTDVILVSDHGFKTGASRLVEDENTAVNRAHEWHERMGILLAAGPSFKQGIRLSARIYDVAPTVLYLLNQPIAKTMEGRVLKEAIRDERLQAQPIRFTDDYRMDRPASEEAVAQEGTEIDPDMLARLEALGYVDTTTTPEVMLNEARTALGAGRRVEAIATLEQLLAAHPQFADAEFVLAQALATSGQQEKSLARWQAMAERDGGDKDPRIQQGLIQSLFNSGHTEEALKQARARVKRHDAMANDWLLLSKMYRAQGEGKQALEVLRQGRRRYPESEEIVLETATLYVDEGRRTQAQPLLETISKDSPHTAMALFQRGRIARAEGDRESAITLWTEAARQQRDFAAVRIALAELLAEVGAFGRADGWLREALRSSQDARIWKLRARIAKARGRNDKAQEYRLRAEKLGLNRVASQQSPN